MSTAPSRASSNSTHRVYRNPGGGKFIRCETTGVEALVGMAEAADTIEVHETGPSRLPRSELMRLTDPLSALSWTQTDLVTDPVSLRHALTRSVSDRLARIRIKTGRHFLAGKVTRARDGIPQRVLLLVLTRTDVQSCDWQLAS
jgi:hypothetical protein